MSGPVPAPRITPGKKPIPAPRKHVPIRKDEEASESKPEPVDIPEIQTIEGKNTFRRKVQTISSDIGGRVNEGKKAVIETTRQSVRKITRRFTNNFAEPSEEVKAPPKQIEPLDVFCISFGSPLRPSDTESLSSYYTNVGSDRNGNNERSSVTQSNTPSTITYEDDEDTPPPPYPPPPLPEETYDVPSVLSGGSTSSEEAVLRKPGQHDYEMVYPSHPYNSDSGSCEDMTAGTIDRNIKMNRSESWNFYDTAQRKEQEEHTYNNVDSTPTMSTTSTSPRSFIRANSLYENCNILPRPLDIRPPTKSILIEFDPILQTDGLTHAEELSELELALQGESHGSINMDNLSIFDDVSEPDDMAYISPPPPPERIDSLADEPSSPIPELRVKSGKESGTSSSQTSWYVGNQDKNTESRPSEKTTSKLLNKFKPLVNKVDSFRQQFAKKDKEVPRPMIVAKRGIQQKGLLFRITKGPVDELFGELNARWCVLQPGALLCYSDNNCDTVKETITIESIMSIQIVQDQKIKYKHEEDELFCFELNTAGRVRAGYVFGTKSQSERRVWMQNLADNMCHAFGPRISSDYKRQGWCYFKSGVNGQWVGAWICLTHRKLYYLLDNTAAKSFDLRKARCFKLQAWDENCPSTTDKGPIIVIHFTSETYYFRMWTQRETKVWAHIIKLAARNNGPNLNQQQLNKHDVPVIVAKCINFLFVHGSMTDGIYRKAGSNLTVSELMNQFRTDAWSVQLTEKYTAHDVANVLKRFFKDLAEPLIDVSKRQYLYQVSLVQDVESRVRMYKGIFDQVHRITYNTSRVLLGHLYFISTLSDKNYMTTTNLAAIWGPTLLHGLTDENDGNMDRKIVQDLIELYNHIFPEDVEQRTKEQKMVQILERHTNSGQGAVNSSGAGDFRIWVFLYNKEGRSFHISVGPNKTAYEILSELSSKVNLPVHELVLEEHVLNDKLTRPIHHGEKVLDVITRWWYWDKADCKDNSLILNHLAKYSDFIKDFTEPLSGELKYADSKTKSYKSYKFEFQQAKLTYYKNRNTSNMLGQWNIEDIFIYFGTEPKRQSPCGVTFFPRAEYPTRNKTRMYFGHVLAFPDPATKARWIATMWRAEHHSNLTPPPQHVNLMSS